MDEQDNERVDELQKRNDSLWETIGAECGGSMFDLITELIEVNIELEQLSNQ